MHPAPSLLRPLALTLEYPLGVRICRHVRGRIVEESRRDLHVGREVLLIQPSLDPRIAVDLRRDTRCTDDLELLVRFRLDGEGYVGE